MKFTKSKKWADFLVFLNLHDYKQIPPPQNINKTQVNFSDYVSYKNLFEELVYNFNALEEDGSTCHCYMEGYIEALNILEFLINEELNDRFSHDVEKFHKELELFLKGQTE